MDKQLVYIIMTPDDSPKPVYAPLRQIDMVNLIARIPKDASPCFNRKTFYESQKLSAPLGVILWAVYFEKIKMV